MVLLFIIYLLFVFLQYFSHGEEASKYNYRYIYSGPRKENEKTGSFHISMTSDGYKNEWKTVVNDDGDIGLIDKIPVLKNVFQKDSRKNNVNIIHDNNIRRKHPINYRKAPVVYEWTSLSNPKENQLNNIPPSVVNDVDNVFSTPFQLLKAEKVASSSKNNLNTNLLDQKSLKFLQPPEFFNSNFNQKLDFSIPWFGARFFERHQPIPDSTSPSDYVRQHTINSYGNGQYLFKEMQNKLNTMFNDLNL